MVVVDVFSSSFSVTQRSFTLKKEYYVHQRMRLPSLYAMSVWLQTNVISKHEHYCAVYRNINYHKITSFSYGIPRTLVDIIAVLLQSAGRTTVQVGRSQTGRATEPRGGGLGQTGKTRRCAVLCTVGDVKWVHCKHVVELDTGLKQIVLTYQKRFYIS